MSGLFGQNNTAIRFLLLRSAKFAVPTIACLNNIIKNL